MVALQAEVKRVQTAADISADQTRTLLARKDQKQKEIDQYKVTLSEMEKQTNDKLTIGKVVADLGICFCSLQLIVNLMLQSCYVQTFNEIYKSCRFIDTAFN